MRFAAAVLQREAGAQRRSKTLRIIANHRQPAAFVRAIECKGPDDDGAARYNAHMFYWLCGRGDEYRIIGGQGWPWKTENQIGQSYGYGQTEGYLPNWRRDNPDDYSAG